MKEQYWSTIHYHNYDWHRVVGTYWKRYPNPGSQHVFSEDIISTNIDEKGRLCIKRFVSKTNKLPSWGEHLFSTRRVWNVEESIVDPKSQTMTIYTRNLNLRFFMGTTEKVTLVPTEDQKSTKAVKETWIESEIYGLRSAIKSFGIDRYKKNCDKATKGFDWVLNRTFSSDKKTE